MAFVTDLRLLLALRIVQGFMGGISTIGLIIVAAVTPAEQLTRRMGTYQSALTLGQIFGPPLGALAAAALGFRGAFLASSALLFGIFLFAHTGLSHIPPQRRSAGAEATAWRQLLFAWAVAFVATVHIVFLPSVLPTVLHTFRIPDARRLVTAGAIVFAYGASAAAGSYGFSRLAGRFSPKRLVLFTASGAAAAQVLLMLGVEPVSFTAIRMLQTALAAGIFPLVLTQAAARGQGRVIGFINMARFAGNAAGPVLATFILAHADLPVLYVTLGGALALAAAGHHLGSRPSAQAPSR
jgi:MFS family permease